MDRNVEMFMNVEKVLLQNKCLSMPTIYVRSDVEKSVTTRVKDIVKRHQGTVTGQLRDLIFYLLLRFTSSIQLIRLLII